MKVNLFKNPIYFIFIVTLILSFINKVLCYKNDRKDKYYLITFKSDEIEKEENEGDTLNRFSYSENQMKKVLSLMLDNKNTYENKELMEEYSIQKEKRDSDSDNSNYLDFLINSIQENSSSLIDILYSNEEKGIYTIRALLSPEIYLKIKNLKGVIDISEDEKIEIYDPIIDIDDDTVNEEDNEIEKDEIFFYYNITDIKKNTNWKNVDTDSYSSSNLSLISQGKFDENIINKYDNTFYYPSTAGKDVNIVIIDDGFMFDHVDFDTTNRIVRCEVICIFNDCLSVKDHPILSKYCTADPENNPYPNHGTKVASTAAGSLYGVAKNANIFGFSVDFSISGFISALIYIKDNEDIFIPSKTIINISSGYYEYQETYQNVLDDLKNKGYMIIASAGNDKINACVKTKRDYIKNGKKKFANDFHYPSGYESVIGVGSINNKYERINKNGSKSFNLYSKAEYSNYGECIDIWAPGYVNVGFPSNKHDRIQNLDNSEYCTDLNKIVEKKDFNKKGYERIKEILCRKEYPAFRKIRQTSEYKEWIMGTSFSSPLVAGVGALIIGEFKNKMYNQYMLRTTLKELALKDIINFPSESGNNQNYLVNNGKDITYSENDQYTFGFCGPRTKTKLYSGIAKERVWSEIRNSSNECLGYIDSNYIKNNKIDKSSIDHDYLVYIPCSNPNVLHFYQYVIDTGDRIIKVSYKKDNKPFKGEYEKNGKYRCTGNNNCCLYLTENNNIVPSHCDNYYNSKSNRKFYSFGISF
ncbi:subtilisin-like protein [Neocallimastix californiae]|uniref:Subtilisin-like protein n=1 Tax=Neocallimastix californiae TaxID=1754190 RepID=A0A1Y1Z5V7_9FUNG|nr:subtilisin-like protein [Neocallimastix californiae]|eukprot:ORY05596.1 subtilisin-like protein [Neocallimastix californiae]